MQEHKAKERWTGITEHLFDLPFSLALGIQTACGPTVLRQVFSTLLSSLTTLLTHFAEALAERISIPAVSSSTSARLRRLVPIFTRILSGDKAHLVTKFRGHISKVAGPSSMKVIPVEPEVALVCWWSCEACREHSEGDSVGGLDSCVKLADGAEMQMCERVSPTNRRAVERFRL